MPRYFIDFEFIEDGKTIDPISIGIVCEDGREFYAENQECDLSKAGDFVQEHVIPQLWHLHGDKREHNAWIRDGGTGGLFHRSGLAREVRVFCSPEQYGKPEFWGYYADYDWVVLCQLFGTMMDLPNGWPKYCHDLKQWCDQLGNPQLPKQESGEHHALADARWNREVHAFLDAIAALEKLAK
jgi:hypothetical protein